MSKTLVAYFSATGTTRKAAEALAEAIGADIYEIKPEVPYTRGDLIWVNPLSRSSKEMKNKQHRPAIVPDVPELAAYDKVYLGFPIWWYVAPTIVNTFLETASWSGQQLVLFATAGSSDFGKTAEELAVSLPEDVAISESLVLKRKAAPTKLIEWAMAQQ